MKPDVKHGTLQLKYATTAILPETRFKLYVECPHRYFFWCNVYRSNKEMIEGFSQLGGRFKRPGKMLACCVSRNGDRKDRELGTVFFSSNEVSPWVLSHEFAHAAHTWARFKGWTFEKDKTKRLFINQRHPEEQFCQVVEYMLHQFYARQPNKVFFTCGRGREPLYMNIRIPKAA